MAIDLSSIKGGVRLKPPKIMLYGQPGVGKTTWAAGAPSPIFLFTEEGQGKLDVQRFEVRDGNPVIQSWEEILECLSALYHGDHPYETLVLDTIDFAERLLWDYTSRQQNQKDIEAFGYGKGYVYAVDYAAQMCGYLESLRNDRNMAIVLIAHCEIRKFSSPEQESYDQYKPRLQDRLAHYLFGWADAVLFAHYIHHVVRDDEGGAGKSKKERRRGVGLGERVIHTEMRPAWWAKNRYGLPPQLPLSWDALVEAMATPQPQEV